MTVVAYPHIQPQGPGPWVEIEQRSATAVNRSPTVGTVRTLDRVGSVWAFTVRLQGLSLANALRMDSFLTACRGHGNRFYLPVWSHDQRGSGFGSELFTNGTFANGTTGWTANLMTLTASDYAIRGTLTRNPTAALGNAYVAQGYSGAVQYLPLAMRSVLHALPEHAAILIRTYFSDGTIEAIDPTGLVRGLVTISLTPIATTGTGYPAIVVEQAVAAGMSVECSFASLARCALVDNGPNLLLQSDEFDATWTPTNATIDDQALAGPDGQTVADYLVEDGTAATVHYVGQAVTVSAAAADYSFGVFLKSGNRTVALLEMAESASGHTADAYFNLATGASGNLTVSGANWANVRAYVVDYGNGWYYCTIVARKVSAGTTLTARIYAGEAMGDASFDGLSQNSIGMWRATLAQSSVPTRPIATTTTATSGTSQTGAALHLKGLPASTSGILRRGDWVQIMQPNGSQLVKVTSALNSDAAGLGYLEFEPMLRESPADSAPVIATNPLARCLLDHNSVRWSRLADNCVDLEFTAIEDIVPA